MGDWNTCVRKTKDAPSEQASLQQTYQPQRRHRKSQTNEVQQEQLQYLLLNKMVCEHALSWRILKGDFRILAKLLKSWSLFLKPLNWLHEDFSYSFLGFALAMSKHAHFETYLANSDALTKQPTLGMTDGNYGRRYFGDVIVYIASGMTHVS